MPINQILQLQVNFPTSHRKGNKLSATPDQLCLSINFMLTCAPTQRLSGTIKVETSPKKDVDFTYQSNSKSTFPQVTEKEINSLLLQVNFCRNSTSGWNYKGESLLKNKMDFLLFQDNFSHKSIFCNSKSTFP